MVAQDIANHELASGARGGLDHALGVGDGFGEGFLDEHVRPRLHRGDREAGVRVGQRVDRHDIGLRGGERGVECREAGGILEVGRQRQPADAARAQPRDRESRDLRIRRGMAAAHRAEADDEDALG